MNIAKYLGFLALGILIGVGAVALLVSPIGKPAIVILLIGAGLVTVGAMAFALISRLFYARLAGQMNTEKNRQLVADLAGASREPERLKALLENNSDSLTGLLPLGLGFLAASRSLNYTALALGGVVGVGGLLTGYIQMERMAEQSRLMTIQNSLTEASRRSAQIFELASIIEGLDDDKSNKDLVLARAANLSRSLRPYQFLTTEKELSEFTSPERGQLLNMLVRAKQDVGDIMQMGADFSFADLKGVDLRGTQLCNINLENADLRSARLNDAELCRANLRSAKLPNADNFRPKSMSGFLTGAIITDEPDWLASQFVDAHSNHNTSEWDRSDLDILHLTPRKKNEFIVVRRYNPPNGGASQAEFGIMNEADFFYWQQYRQVDGTLQASEVRSSGGRSIELSSFRDPEDQMIELAEQLVANIDRPGGYWRPQHRSLPISKNEQISGLPEDTELFEYMAALGTFPAAPNFSGISPGGADATLTIERSPLSPDTPVSLKNADFSTADLRYVDFGDADLQGAKFHGALMPPYSAFEGANIEGADFRGAVFAEKNPGDGAMAGPDWPAAVLEKHGPRVKPDCVSTGRPSSVDYCIYVAPPPLPVIMDAVVAPPD